MIIRQLDSTIYNKIAAGEVVERPRSVVKELAENAIDAGANRIAISIIEGGKTLIDVSDNGCGISPQYIKTAFLPHATSKIVDVDDLYTISTLGFRGEALASIASISQVTACSQMAGGEGVQLVVEGGVFGDILPWSGANGTTFVVKNLFFNTPAREKFMKTVRGEEGEITSLVQELIIANPNIAFTYNVDNKRVYTSQGNGLAGALYAVYDRAIITNLLEVNYSRGDMTVRGYISTPSYTKSTRSYQTTMINGRVIVNSSISAAVNQGYAQMLMRRAFPVFVLDITMPFDQVDVNVTPNKSDVRFSDSKAVFSLIYRAVKDVLDKLAASNAISIAGGSNFGSAADGNVSTAVHSNTAGGSNFDSTYTQNISISSDTSQIAPNLEQFDQNIAENCTFSSNTLLDDLKNIKGKQQSFSRQSSIVAESSSPIFVDINSIPQIASGINNVQPMSTIDGSGLNEYDSNNPSHAITSGSGRSQDVANSPPLAMVRGSGLNEFINQQLSVDECISDEITVLGQIFNAYLVVIKGANMYLLDQHACHERLNYDNLCKAIGSGNIAVQPLLIPQMHTLSPNDFNTIIDLADELKTIGIEIEEFGSFTVKVNQIPVVIQGFNLKNFIDEILSTVKFSKIKLADILKDRLAITACKASIRAGDRLNDYQIDALIAMMKDNLPLQCPHGRPAVIVFDKKSIDKMFKRIL